MAVDLERRPDALPASSPTSRGPRAFAGTVLVLAGLGLVLLGGCFLLGALLLLRPDLANPGLAPTEWDGRAAALWYAVFAAGGLCLLGAAVLIVVGGRGLIRILEERLTSP